MKIKSDIDEAAEARRRLKDEYGLVDSAPGDGKDAADEKPSSRTSIKTLHTVFQRDEVLERESMRIATEIDQEILFDVPASEREKLVSDVADWFEIPIQKPVVVIPTIIDEE